MLALAVLLKPATVSAQEQTPSAQCTPTQRPVTGADVIYEVACDNGWIGVVNATAAQMTVTIYSGPSIVSDYAVATTTCGPNLKVQACVDHAVWVHDHPGQPEGNPSPDDYVDSP